MKIKTENGHITIADDSIEAKKISEGFSYSVINGNLVVGNDKINFDLKSFKDKLKNKTATLSDIQEFLLKKIINDLIN